MEKYFFTHLPCLPRDLNWLVKMLLSVKPAYCNFLERIKKIYINHIEVYVRNKLISYQVVSIPLLRVLSLVST